MKLITFLAISLLCVAPKVGYCQAVISGIIIDSNHSPVVLFEPISGFYNDDLAGPEGLVALDQEDYFERNLPLEEPMMLCLRIGMRPIHFFAEPGDTIRMEIDVNKFTDYAANGGITFRGKNAAGNKYFNEFNFNPGRKIGMFKAIVEDSLRLWQNFKFETIDYGLAQITSGFDALFRKGEITKEFYDLIVPGIRSALVSKEVRDLLLHRKGRSFGEAVALGKKIFERYPLPENIAQKSPFNRTTASSFYGALASQNYPTYHLADSMITVNGQKLFVNRNLVNWLFAPEEIQQVFWPITLIRLKSLFADSYGKRDVETFLALHPNSPVKRYLQSP